MLLTEEMAAPAEVPTTSPPESESSTLQTIVDLVRRIMHADAASILNYSLDDETVTWKAASGFRAPDIDYQQPVIRPFAVEFVRRALAENTVVIFEGIGLKPDLPAEDFPAHVAEGIHYLAVAPLPIHGNRSGAVTAGFRTPHHFSDDEKRLLQDLAAMAAVALENAQLLETVREDDARLRLTHQAARIGTFELDLETGVNVWSPELEAMHGLESGGFAGTQSAWEALVHPEDRSRALALASQAFETREPVEGDWRVIWPDGTVHWLSGRFQVFSDPSGNPLHLTGVNIDITEGKEAEGLLRASEERAQRDKKIWEQTFDAIGEGILVYDEQRRIIRCNTRAAEMIDMHPALLMKLTFNDAFARLLGPEAADYYLSQSRGEQSVFEAQTEFGRRYLISIFTLKLSGETVSVASWNDVTRLSEMQEQLARSRRLGSVGQLAAGVAHEINNPLAAIATCAEAIIRDLRREKSLQGVADEHQWPYYLEEIVRQSMRCKDITRGLLDLTQQRQARRALSDVNHLARECAKAALQQTGSANVEVEIRLDENIGEVATDASMVRQIVDNLLSNAVDALGDKGGKVTITTARDGNRVVIEVADDGPGISAELMTKIFDPFMSTKGPGKGYGLGLAICATLAESLGGSMTVESKEGEGSRFRLWIPRRAPEK